MLESRRVMGGMVARLGKDVLRAVMNYVSLLICHSLQRRHCLEEGAWQPRDSQSMDSFSIRQRDG